MAEFVKFTEHLVMGGFNYAYGVSAADITGNGCLDLIAADTSVGLYWFENDGSGNFKQHIIHEREDEWLERHAIADINGDGRPEIVIVDNINGCLLWFEFDGDPRDRNSWSHHYITEGDLPGAYDVAVADFDGDGDPDICMTNRTAPRLRFLRNDLATGNRWISLRLEGDPSMRCPRHPSSDPTNRCGWHRCCSPPARSRERS